MKPLSKNKLIEEYAAINNLDVELVSVIIHAYWKEVRLTMNELQYPRIRIPYFATMMLLPHDVSAAIIKNKNILSNIPPTSFSNFEKYRIIEEKVKKLELLKLQLDTEKQDHERFKQEKKTKL